VSLLKIKTPSKKISAGSVARRVLIPVSKLIPVYSDNHMKAEHRKQTKNVLKFFKLLMKNDGERNGESYIMRS
jgi:hypothetical protein